MFDKLLETIVRLGYYYALGDGYVIPDDMPEKPYQEEV